MPCYDPPEANDNVKYGGRPSRTEALLCAILTLLEEQPFLAGTEDVFDIIDWEEAGVSRRWAENWWERHKIDDQKRREKLRAKKSGLSKLTDEEKEALGLCPF